MRKILALLLFAVCLPAFAAPGIGGIATTSNFGSSIVSPAASTTTGNSVVVATASNQAFAGAGSGILDTAGNTWTHLASDVQYNGTFRFFNTWICQNCTGNASEQVQVTFGGGSQSSVIGLVEVTGVATSSLDQHPAPGTGSYTGSSVPGQSATTTSSSELVMEIWATNNSGTCSAPTSSFTLTQTHNDGSSVTLCFGALTVASTGTYSSNVTHTTATGSYASAVITLAATGGGSTCTHAGLTAAGATTVPTASSTNVWKPASGAFGTVDCSSVNYYQPTNGGAIGVN